MIPDSGSLRFACRTRSRPDAQLPLRRLRGNLAWQDYPKRWRRDVLHQRTTREVDVRSGTLPIIPPVGFMEFTAASAAHHSIGRTTMLRKSGAKILVLLLAATALNPAIVLVGLSFSSKAAVANMDYSALVKDADFKKAVQSIAEACSVNMNLAQICC